MTLESDCAGARSPRPRAARSAPSAPAARGVLAIFTAILAAACQTGPKYDPFRVPAAEIRARVSRIALAPLRAASKFVDRDGVQQRLHRAIAARLTAGGFEVVDANVMSEIWRAAADDVGGIYDAKTGEGDDERWEAVRNATYRELRGAHEVDAVLYMGLVVESSYLDGRTAFVCGIRDELYWTGDWGLMTVATAVQNLCLGVELVDLDGRPLYSIQVGGENFETYAQQTLARRPIAERFRDAERLARIVDHVIGPLADPD